MSLCTYAKLLRSKDDPDYRKKLAVLLACKMADVSPPSEIDEYFGGEGKNCNPEFPLEVNCKALEWSDGEGSSGLEISISEIPIGISVIRFINSW